MYQGSEKRKVGRPERNDVICEPEHAEGWLDYEEENLPDQSTTPNAYTHMFGETEFENMTTDTIRIRIQDIPTMVPIEAIYPNKIKQPVWLRNLIKDANSYFFWDKDERQLKKTETETQELYKGEVARLIKIRVKTEKAEARKQADKEELQMRRQYFTHHLPEMARLIKIVEVQSSGKKFLQLKEAKKIRMLTCYRCHGWNIEDCRCSDIIDRLRIVCCGPDACVLEKWCVICDRHELFCTCKFKYGSRMIPEYLFYGWYLREDWYVPLEKQYYEHMEKSDGR